MENRYFIEKLPHPNMTQIYVLVVGTESTQTVSNDGAEITVKLPIEWSIEPLAIQTPGILQNAIEYTRAGIKLKKKEPNWIKLDGTEE